MSDKKISLLFVYNADSGLFNTLTDIAHKIFSPSTYACSLCQITHGNFSMRNEWKDFIESFDIPCEFLHKDEAAALLPGFDDYPAVFIRKDSGLQLCLSRQQIDDCDSIDALKAAIQQDCTDTAEES
jgi:hypothetical protein